MKRFSYYIVGLLLAGSATACGGDDTDGGIPDLGAAVNEVARQCGLACPGKKDVDGVEIKGVLEGNTSISGVAQVDAFFASVNNFRGAADGVSGGIEAQLALIRADFGIDAKADLKAELDAKIKANIEGGITVDYKPAECSVDAKATVEAQARCDVMATPGKLEVACKGSCELEANAELKCDANAELECSFTGPTVDCQGECSGTCEAKLDVAAKCEGTCRGECSGGCSAYSDSGATQCSGSCDGMCKGTCEAKASASAKCMGTCRGECKLSGPDAKCMGSAHASCKAKANAMIMCSGRCEGDFEPPMVSAECKASAKAEAKLNVECTPPEIAINYKLKANLDAMAKAKFELALKTFVKVRMPALMAAIGRANSIASAGEDLALAADGAVKAAVNTAIKGDVSFRAKFGLTCALGELPRVEMAMANASDRLTDNINAGLAVAGMIGVK